MKSFHSSRVVPVSSETPWHAPARTGWSADCGSTSPSATGWKGSSPTEVPSRSWVCACASTSRCAGTSRSARAASAGAMPSAPRNTSATRVAASRVWK